MYYGNCNTCGESIIINAPEDAQQEEFELCEKCRGIEEEGEDEFIYVENLDQYPSGASI